MQSDDLTPLQLQGIRTGLMPLARYLAKVRERMHQRGFDADDELFALKIEFPGSAVPAMD